MGGFDASDDSDPWSGRTGIQPVDEPLEVVISEAVADEIGCEPYDLPIELYEVVDAEALDDAFSSPLLSGSASFEYCGYHVTVFHDKTVSVEPCLP